MSIVSWHDLIKAAFPSYDGEDASFNGNGVIEVTFSTPQIPADLGPLVRVEVVDPNAPRLP